MGRREGRVEAFLEEPTRRRPPVPFSTTLFVSEATRQGLGAAYAMRIAEDLYTQGLISYPRTDNTVYPRVLGLRALVERFKDGAFKEAAEFVLAQETFRATRGRSETTDHPPIYPTGVTDPKKLEPDHAKVYELVVRRFLATVAPDSTGLARTTTVDIRGEKFDGKGQILVDPGWYRVYPYSTPEQAPMPILTVGQNVEVRSVTLREDQTRPPKRFTQGTLIQEMERLGLGTKSTRHDVLQKLFDRHYVQQRSLEPTVTGIAVTEALKAHAPLITRPEMTHRLEEEMEARRRVEEGEGPGPRRLPGDASGGPRAPQEELRGGPGHAHRRPRQATLRRPVRPLRRGPSPRPEPEGARWVQCVNNPGSCTATYNLPSAGFIEPAPEFLCGTCKVPRVKITFRGQRPDLYCINPECAEHHKAFRIGVCPNSGHPLEIRYSFLGKRFVGCTGYPTCRVTYPLPQRGKLEKDQPPCPVCKAPVVTAIEAGRPPWTLCINPECPTRVKAPKPASAEKGSSAAAKRKPRARARVKAPVGGAPVEAPPVEAAPVPAPVPVRRKSNATGTARRTRRSVSAPAGEESAAATGDAPQ